MTNQNINQVTNRRDARFWLIRFTLLLGLSLLFYCGYCFGLWGQRSLLLQYLFQCNCPAFSEEWRYPKEVDVIVSACHENWVELSPTGRFLAVYQGENTLNLIYLLDLQIMERITAPKQPYSSYLTDDLGFRKYPEPHIIDRTTGAQYSIKEYMYAHPGTYVNGYADPSKLAVALQEAKNVYFIHSGLDTVVALTSDFHTDREKDFFVEDFDIPGSDPNRMERFLRENHINFQTETSFPEEAISPDGRFVARRQGIFGVGTNKKIEEGVSLWLRGWTYDGSGVIYSTRYGGPCLIELPELLGSRCLVEVPQPVILLKVQEEYLSPTP